MIFPAGRNNVSAGKKNSPEPADSELFCSISVVVR